MTSPTVAVPGGRLHVVVERDVSDDGAPAAPAILLLHAGIADLTSWDAIVPMLTAAGHRVVRYDARGFGLSVTDDVDYSDRADAIAVLDAIGIRRAALVGNSRGGQVAVAGAFDATEVVHTARHLEAQAPDARAVILPDVAHMIGMEAPDRLAAIIIDSLAQGRPGS